MGASRVAAVLLVACATVASARASCMPAKDFSTFGEGGYRYIQTPAAAANTFSSIVGRFWQPGAYASSDEQTCAEVSWLRPYPSGSHTWYIGGSLGSAGCATAGCPSGALIVSLEDRSTDGNQAYFAVGRVDESPLGWVDFDFSRTGTDWTLIPLPSALVVNATGGEVFQATVAFGDPAAGFHGVTGAQASGTITALLLYQAGTTPVTRERATWTFVGRYPYAGGITQGQAVLVCPTSGAVRLAAALELDGGQVLTHYVSAQTTYLCDTYAPGAGAIDDGGPDALFVKREPSGDLTLSWGFSCSEGDRSQFGGYEVYEGTLGDWGSHVPRACSMSYTTRTLTLEAGDGDAYYLVVPYEDTYEGSYGKRSDGLERPRNASACRQRIVNTCPP